MSGSLRPLQRRRRLPRGSSLSALGNRCALGNRSHDGVFTEDAFSEDTFAEDVFSVVGLNY